MAKLSSVLRNEKRKQLVAKYAEQRKALKAIIKRHDSTPEEKRRAQDALNRLPRNSSPVRVRNRCALSGRVRGYLRRFGISRIDFRLLALKGEIPGVRKSSW
ncbi:30S ribosomal protein S14 [Candidatus Nitrospira inopinata]|uniref:Small ribosomal subunit protein uS14 n=1 Tax=Candidatus Nitrospira inopinata TaxID=1715989 RepID=A0A0S4KVC7_9BACT|nr:30S ribosomal protein S14 [Candidatus Nitrospira inopinata]CUQ67305.1 30S ribosomal protein S14 [Candidatus Nitrospira inopinata]